MAARMLLLQVASLASSMGFGREGEEGTWKKKGAKDRGGQPDRAGVWACGQWAATVGSSS